MTDKNTTPPEEIDEQAESDATEAVLEEKPGTEASKAQGKDMGAATEPEESELEKARKEASEMKSRYLRVLADLENYRKRISREKQEIIRSAATSVIESLLPVLDNMKLGLQAAENHPEARDVTVGFKMVEDQLKRSLAEQGLEELVPNGESFDPNLHECLAHQPSEDVAEDHVIQTVRAGYRLNERLIRAANVIVSSGPAKTADNS